MNYSVSTTKISHKQSDTSKKINILCEKCKKSITYKLCFCGNESYYNEHIEIITKLQKYIKSMKWYSDYKKLTKKQILVNQIFRPNKMGISEWKTRDDLSNTPLKLSNNGNSRHGKFYNDTRFIWEKKIEKRTVVAIRTNGYDKSDNNINKRSIRKDIKEYHYKTGCVCCGCTSDLVVDHKNDLYNDPRVLNINTQNIDDFQCLCTHCNLQKRQVCKHTIECGRRYGATNIPQLEIFGIDFISGDETFNPNDIDALKGTYWYDVIAVMEQIKISINSV